MTCRLTLPTDSKLMASTPSPPRIFVSYARSDGESFARKLGNRLAQQGFSLWQDRTEMEGGRGWWDQIVEALKSVEYCVLVMTPAALRSDVVKREWRLARQNGVCVIPVFGTSDLDISSLPGWMKKSHFVNIDVPEQWTRLIRTLESPCRTPRVPFMAPFLPSDFIPRQKEFESLVEALLNPVNQEPAAITAALCGAGGYGKTTLAMALCHDERIQEAFDDGILWVTLGERPGDLTERIRDLIEMLSGERPGFATLEVATTHLTQLLQDQVILVVIDDVWDATHLKPFLQGGSHCARLITTRNRDTLPSDTKGLPVDAMQGREAVKLLGRGLTADASDRTRLSQLADRVGHWPLLLKLVRATLQERLAQGQPLLAAVSYVEKALDRKGLHAFDVQNASERHQAVAKTLALSLELLQPQERVRYEELAIFPEDAEISLAIVTKWWGATGQFDDFQTEELCVKLHRLSLLLNLDLATQRIRLHDVMRTYLQEQIRNQLSMQHIQFLDACTPSRWSDLDPQWHYLYTHVPYHLYHADRHDKLKELLLNFNWLHAKLRAMDVTSVVNDYAWLSEDAALREVQGALRLSAHILANDNDQLAPQLVGRLLSSLHQNVISLVKQAQQWKGRPWLRPLTASLTKPGGPLMHTFSGHTGSITALALTPNQRQVVSAADDCTLKVWDLITGQEVHTLTGHSGRIRALAVTPNGRQVVSSSIDHTLKVWDLMTGQEVHTLTGHSGDIRALVLTPNGQQVISASGDRTLKVWDLMTGQEVHTLTGHSGGVRALALTPDGRQVVSASSDRTLKTSRDHTLKIWDLVTGQEIESLTSHSRGIVTAVAVTPNGSQIVSASDDGTLKVWDLSTGQELHTITGHSRGVTAVAIAPNGWQMVSASASAVGMLKVWDLRTGEEVYTLTEHSSGVRSLALSPDGGQMVSASGNGTLKVWDLTTGEAIHTLTGHSRGVTAVAFMSNGRQVVSASEDRTLKVWNLTTNDKLPALTSHRGEVRAVALTPDGRRVVSASKDGTLKVWDLTTGEELHTLSGHTDWVTAIALTPDGERVVSAAWDETLKVWDLMTGKELHTLTGHSSVVLDLAITPDGRQVVSTSGDGTLKVWDLTTGETHHTLSGHTGWVTAVALTPDGSQVISASGIGTLKVWNLATGEEVHTLRGHTNKVTAAVVTPNGGQVVSASRDNTLKVWDLTTGQEVRKLTIETSWVAAIARTPDGRQLVFALGNGIIKVWDLVTGEELHALLGHGLVVTAVAITLDGRQVVSASEDGMLKVWDLEHARTVTTFQCDAPIACLCANYDKIFIAGDRGGNVHFLHLEE
ncbi:MAG: TIR domain-containing protein [Nitrospira sp.]